MKILFMVSSMNAGGAERVAATLANAWVEAGHEVVLLATFGKKARSFYALDSRVSFQWLSDWPQPAWRRYLGPVSKLAALRGVLKAQQPDLVLSFLTNVNVMALMATIGLACPVVVCERTHPVYNRSSGPVLRGLRRLLYRRAQAVLVQTQDAAAALHTQAPGIKNVSSIPNPVPPEWLNAPPAARLPDAQGRRQLVAMGRLVPGKRFDCLIRVFAQLADQFPHWDLVIYGEGPERAALEAQVQGSGLASRISLPGRTSQPHKALSSAAAFALTSAVEGFPNVLLEAMAAGLPCISFDCPSGPAEMTRNGADALLVPAGDEAAFAAQLARLLADSTLQDGLAVRARQRVQSAYALPVVLAQWQALFQALGLPGIKASVKPLVPALASPIVPAPAAVSAQARSLHVVHIISGLGQGGAETVLYRLTSAAEPGLRHTVISMSDEGEFGQRFQEAGIDLRTLGMPWGRLTFSGLLGLWRLLRTLRPDVVQTWMYHADLIGGLVARLAGIRALAWGVRNSGQFLHKSSRATRLVAWVCARVSGIVPAAVISCSQTAALLHIRWGYRARKMVVIPNGYDLSQWRPNPEAREAVRHELGLSDDAVLIGSVGRWNPLKDHANLLGALALLRDSRPQLYCALVGLGLDENNAELAALLKQNGVADRVLLLGPRRDVPDLINALDVHVLSSFAEAFPNVVAEAMASGIPCVVTNVGDAALIVQQEGWVVPPRDAQALAAGILQALDALGTTALQQRLAAGRQRMHQLYSLQTMVEAYRREWTRLAQGKLAARRPGALPGLGPEAAATTASEQQASKKKLLMVVNNPAFFLSHRLPVALAAQQAGFDVHIATMDGPTVAQIVQHGFQHHRIRLNRSGTNPLGELGSLLSLWRLFRALRPDIVHAVTIKPVLYGGIAARLAGVPAYVAAISGLGYLFTRAPRRIDFSRWAARFLYRRALRQADSRVIFQNTSDRDVLLAMGAVVPGQLELIKGSGVDLTQFRATPEPEGPIRVVMAARLLADKGVREYVAAARLSRQQDDGLIWQLAGSPDPANPASISAAELKAWCAEGIIEYLGESDCIAKVYQQAHIVVLPSYREGLPKSLIEAAASGRAVVTSDVPGCRDAIVPDVSGLLVPLADAPALHQAVARLASNTALRQSFGQAGRLLAESEFDVKAVVEQHLSIYRALV